LNAAQAARSGWTKELRGTPFRSIFTNMKYVVIPFRPLQATFMHMKEAGLT
jgi:hypothetical protein